MANILLVEDDIHINKINEQALKMRGHNPISVTSASKCLNILKEQHIDIIVLDIGLPDKSGILLCSEIKQKYNIPVLFLSAMGENIDILTGFNAGGDDYITKPYDLDVFLARINARLRNSNMLKTELSVGNLRLDSIPSIAYCNDQDLILTKKEFSLLWVLAGEFSNVVSKEVLYKAIWGSANEREDASIWPVISRLKNKLSKVDSGMTIVSERLKGYRLDYAKRYQ